MSRPSLDDDKQKWRKWAKQKRLGLAETTALALINYLKDWQGYQDAQHILSYLAFGAELSLEALHSDLSKTFYTTRTQFKPTPQLSIHSLNSKLEQHRFGYWQPVANAPKVDPKLLDLVLVPGLAFDASGGRLGYGMGFYDRLLSKVRQDTRLVAITSSSLVVEALPQEDFDIKMTHLATEHGIIEL